MLSIYIECYVEHWRMHGYTCILIMHKGRANEIMSHNLYIAGMTH